MRRGLLKEIEKIANKYHKNMQLEMQRFANEIMELKFEKYEKDYCDKCGVKI